MKIPENLKYTKDHEWIKLEGDEAVVGITDYAQGELGDIVFVEIETLGEKLGQGDIFGSIEAVKTVSDLFMPVGGEVIAVNDKIGDTPELINTDPFGEGWLIRIKVADFAELGSLLSASDYAKQVEA